MDGAFDSRDERGARRLGIVARIVLYPMALALIVLAWQHYRSDPTQAGSVHIATWIGVTSQDQSIQGTNDDGVLMGFTTRVLERCSNGTVFIFDWYPAKHRFVQHGKHLRGRQAGGGRATSGEPMVYENRVWARIGSHPRGTIRAQVRLTSADGVVRCASGPVTFGSER
jgi:hypothetical protein